MAGVCALIGCSGAVLSYLFVAGKGFPDGTLFLEQVHIEEYDHDLPLPEPAGVALDQTEQQEHLGLQCRVRRVRAHRDQQRVAVGRRGRDRLRADHVGGTGPVLHEDGHAPAFVHALGEQAPERIDRAARRERHDDPNRLLGIFVDRLRERSEWR